MRRHHVEYELRSASDGEVVYEVKLPFNRTTDRLAAELLGLNKGIAVKWEEKKVKPAGT